MKIKSSLPTCVHLCLIVVLLIGFWCVLPTTAAAQGVDRIPTPGDPSSDGSFAWWVWLILLFVLSFFLGIVAVVAGVGGGVLFVPVVSGFFPFHLDFVRGAGLMVAIAGALSASPGLLQRGLANLKLALPMALVASVFSILGAYVGLVLPVGAVQTALGGAIVGIVVLMAVTKRSAVPGAQASDLVSRFLKIGGSYFEESLNRNVSWTIQRTPQALVLFIVIGFLGGMFGLGAGWANVPVFNILLGAPLKLSVATSLTVISINSSAAAWVYITKGAVLPIIAVPAVAGMMLGTRIGVVLLTRAKSEAVRVVVLIMLLFAGIRSMLKGLGVWT